MSQRYSPKTWKKASADSFTILILRYTYIRTSSLEASARWQVKSSTCAGDARIGVEGGVSRPSLAGRAAAGSEIRRVEAGAHRSGVYIARGDCRSKSE